MGLTDIVKQGRRLGMALLMAGSVSCLRPLRPAQFQVKDDYDRYHPKYRKGIALHNINNILQENCDEGYHVDEREFMCKYSFLLPQGSGYVVEQHTNDVRWDEIQTTGVKQNDPRYSCLKVNDKCRIFYIRSDQIWALKKAVDIYLQETRTSRTPSDKPGYIK